MNALKIFNRVMKVEEKMTLLMRLALLVQSIGHVFGIRTEKTPSYKLIVREGCFEIRLYDDYILAETIIDDIDYKRASNIGFKRLAAFIFGNNLRQEQINMTAPVLQEICAEQIPMTSPVLQEKTNAGWTMSFIMPSKYDLSTLPKPLDQRIVIRTVSSHMVGVLRYSGFVSDANIKKKTALLTKWLTSKSYSPTDLAKSARYDPPFTLPFLRKNEIHLRVKKA